MRRNSAAQTSGAGGDGLHTAADPSAPRSSARSSPTCSSATWSDTCTAPGCRAGSRPRASPRPCCTRYPRRSSTAWPPPTPSRSRRSSSSRRRSASSHSSRPGSYPVWSCDGGCEPPRAARQTAERMPQHRTPSRVRPSRSLQMPLTARADRPSAQVRDGLAALGRRIMGARMGADFAVSRPSAALSRQDRVGVGERKCAAKRPHLG